MPGHRPAARSALVQLRGADPPVSRRSPRNSVSASSGEADRGDRTDRRAPRRGSGRRGAHRERARAGGRGATSSTRAASRTRSESRRTDRRSTAFSRRFRWLRTWTGTTRTRSRHAHDAAQRERARVPVRLHRGLEDGLFPLARAYDDPDAARGGAPALLRGDHARRGRSST